MTAIGNDCAVIVVYWPSIQFCGVFTCVWFSPKYGLVLSNWFSLAINTTAHPSLEQQSLGISTVTDAIESTCFWLSIESTVTDAPICNGGYYSLSKIIYNYVLPKWKGVEEMQIQQMGNMNESISMTINHTVEKDGYETLKDNIHSKVSFDSRVWI